MSAAEFDRMRSRIGLAPSPSSNGHGKLKFDLPAYNGADLLTAVFPEPKWAVPGIIPEGLTLCCGAPKLGKSFLALNIAVAVATGGVALGHRVAQGDVLYLALEDTGRRLQTRLIPMIGDGPAPSRLTLPTAIPRFPEAGMHLRLWCDEHPERALIVVDVLVKVKERGKSSEAAYEADYAAATYLKNIADEYGVPILALHHVRKLGADDWLERVSGTNGLAGAADAVHFLSRSRGEATAALKITGRDFEESEFALTFDPATLTWQAMEGPAVDHTVAATRRRILAAVDERIMLTPRGIADMTGIDYELAKKTARRMADDGQLSTDGNGSYFRPRDT